MIDLEDARARGVALPADDAVAQDVIDEQEAWLAAIIGPLEGERTETFQVRPFGPIDDAYSDLWQGRLFLARTTDAAVVLDNGATVADAVLAYNGQAVRRRSSLNWPLWWTGPLVEVTYEPNDLLAVRRVLYTLTALAVDDRVDSPFSYEQIGQYSYSKGGGRNASVGLPGIRTALAKSLIPRRPGIASLPSGPTP